MTQTTVRVKADAEALRISRAKLNQIKDDIGERFDDVVLVVSELVTNAVRYGQGDIDVAVKLLPEKILVEVSDKGRGFSSDAPRGDGMGLNIIERIADDWGIRLEGYCVVWAELSPAALTRI